MKLIIETFWGVEFNPTSSSPGLVSDPIHGLICCYSLNASHLQ